jgi:dephospho-CoA kinase
MKCFAITGGIGCGKSELARMLAERGCRVLDADVVVHELESVPGEAVTAIREAFGRDVLRADGGVDRGILGRRVFGDPAALAVLNAIIHPLVRRRFREWLAAPAEGDGDIRVGVIPLLYETGWTDGWHGVACVACAPEEQVRRLRARGWPDDEIRRRIGAQMPLAEKERRADWVIRNDGSLGALEREADALLHAMAEKKI